MRAPEVKGRLDARDTTYSTRRYRSIEEKLTDYFDGEMRSFRYFPLS
jgi:hypothetical protein